MTYQEFLTINDQYNSKIFEFDKHTYEKWYSYLTQQNELYKQYPKHYKKFKNSIPKMTLDQFIDIMKK